MASSNSSNDREKSSAHSSSSRGLPKAQLPLQKILLDLNNISATPADHQFHQVHVSGSSKEQPFAIASSSSSYYLSVSNVVSDYDSAQMGYSFLDLNLPPPPETPQDSPSPLQQHDTGTVQECNPRNPAENKHTSMLQSESFEDEMGSDVALGGKLEKAESEERKEAKGVGEREEKESEIRFGALLDAVECAMGEYGSKPREPRKAEETLRKRQPAKWKTLGGKEEKEKEKEMVQKVMAVLAEEVSTSPVVKSKRGRTQVLPYKYRDSVIEPLTHLSSRHSRSSSNYGSNKRRPG